MSVAVAAGVTDSAGRRVEVLGCRIDAVDMARAVANGFRLSRALSAPKHALAFAGALAGLILASPLFAVIALAVRLDSKGRVLYRQRRVGQDGKSFAVIKFRTMIDGAHAMRAELAGRNQADGLFRVADDPRITRVGRHLRRLSLDELRQLLNVLFGEMSLVGPRPLVMDEDERVQGWYRQRLMLTPGMTGRWQILGAARIPLSEMVKLDCLYVTTWSLWNDVKILLRTLPFVAGRTGL